METEDPSTKQMSEESASQTLAKQGGVTFFGNIVGRVLGFVFLGTVTRLVSPDKYGVFVLALSLVSFFFGFANLSMQRAVDYFVPQYLQRGNYRKAKGTIVMASIIAIVTSSGIAIVLFGLSTEISNWFEEPGLDVAIVVLSVSLPLKSQFDVLLASFNSMKALKYRVITRDIGKNLIQIGLTTVLLLSGAGLVGLLYGYVLSLLAAVIMGILLLFARVSWLRQEELEIVNVYPLLKYTFPLMFAGVIYSAVAQVDFFIIGYFLESGNVGIYKVSYQVASGLLIVISAISPVFKPMVSEVQSNKQEVAERYRLATRWITMLTIPMAVTLFLAAEAYLSVLFTPAYAAGSAALIALSVGYLLNAAFGPEGMMLEGFGYTKLTFMNTSAMILTNIALNLLLIPRFGIIGAGVATAVSTSLAVVLGVVQLYLLDQIHPFTTDLAKLWFAAVPMTILGGLLVLTLNSRLLIVVLLPVITPISYLLFIRSVGGFTEEDVKIANAIDSWFGRTLLRRIITK